MLTISAHQVDRIQETTDREVCRKLTNGLRQTCPQYVAGYTDEELEQECYGRLRCAVENGLGRDHLTALFITLRFVPAADLAGVVLPSP